MLPRAELPMFLVKLGVHEGDPIVRVALNLTVLTMVRTIEIRGARWDEIDFKEAV